MNFATPVAIGFGWVVAAVVLVVCIVLGVMGNRDPLLGLIALLALARMLP